MFYLGKSNIRPCHTVRHHTTSVPHRATGDAIIKQYIKWYDIVVEILTICISKRWAWSDIQRHNRSDYFRGIDLSNVVLQTVKNCKPSPSEVSNIRKFSVCVQFIPADFNLCKTERNRRLLHQDIHICWWQGCNGIRTQFSNLHSSTAMHPAVTLLYMHSLCAICYYVYFKC